MSHNLARLESALGPSEIHYAVKCNPHPSVLAAVHSAGGGFEVASVAELRTLERLGLSASEVLYSNPVRSPAHIREAWEMGLWRFSFDSLSELDKLADIAPGASVYVRLATDGASCPLNGKFGVGPKEALDLMLAAVKRGLVPYGCTFHVGSQTTDARAWESPLDECAWLMTALEDQAGVRLAMVNVGGGFPADYDEPGIPALEAIGSSIRRKVAALPYPVRLVAEPGRVLVADAAVLATSVIGRREHRGATWIHLDAGAYNGMMEGGGFLGRLRHAVASRPRGLFEPVEPCTLTGPTCDDADTLQSDTLLPAELEPGDRVYFATAGAYSASLATTFNGFDPPRTHMREPANGFTASVPRLANRSTISVGLAVAFALLASGLLP
ncbi:MAG: type III PLP-dependent enzyme [Actinomycetota bacterium]